MVTIGICLGLSAVFVHGRRDVPVVAKQRSLDQAFSRVGSWTTTEEIGFDPWVIEALHLDDYIHRTYGRGNQTVWVYIGYYLSRRGLAASHSPLVCYPGQGWQISDRRKSVLEIEGHRLHVMSMVVAKGEARDLVFYWFQAYDRNSASTFRQKLQGIWTRIADGRAENAFVRISVPIGEGGRAGARETALAFLGDFYPLFYEYVMESEPRRSARTPGLPLDDDRCPEYS